MSKGTNTMGYQPNWDNINKLIDEGYINKKTHPEDDSINIYCYTNACQYDNKWTKDTLICRGLITKNGKVISRPFPKFFNYQEFSKSQANILKGEWEVFEKMDGSLGILYEFADGDYRISTKGSFDSEQAIWATNYLKDNYPEFKPLKNTTWLFEIIYPENRIVVDYHGAKGIYLLDILITQDGSRLPFENNFMFPLCESHGITETFNHEERDNKEGFVLVNKKGFRVKVKHDEYVNLHKIKSSLSNTLIWEKLKSGDGIDEIIDNTGDEFYEWIKDTEKSLTVKHDAIIDTATYWFENKPETDCRKTLAKYFSGYSYPFICFSWLDEKDCSQKIWDLIKPERQVAISNFNSLSEVA